jgi:hypothetical protein
MKLAIMQPYFFPYIGYWQLINSVDMFVLYDDVQFIKGGWINRNFILAQGQKKRITLQLQGASPNLTINSIEVGVNKEKILKTIIQNYSKAPYFNCIHPLLERIFNNKNKNLAEFIEYSILQICEYLDICPQWHVSSTLRKDTSLRGQDKVLAICKEVNASHYINMLGGRNLYDLKKFKKEGITLLFLEPKSIKYKQFNNQFVPNLSILDIMMFNSQEKCKSLLKEYSLV